MIYSIDFFVKNIWDYIVDEWKEPLLSMSPEECILFPEGNHLPDTWPSSLINFVNTSRSLAMPRAPVNFPRQLPENQPNAKHMFNLPALTLHMTPKKQHEVERLATLVAEVVQQVAGNTVIDVGSGEGYLTQVGHHKQSFQCLFNQ